MIIVISYMVTVVSLAVVATFDHLQQLSWGWGGGGGGGGGGGMHDT